MGKYDSVVRRQQDISSGNWVVSLVCKPEGKNPEHAILIVEGVINHEGDEVYCVRRYDFVVGEEVENDPVSMLERHLGAVVARERLSALDDKESCFWGEVMKDRGMEEGCKGISWHTTRDYVDTLHENVLQDAKDPPDYQISGEHASAPSVSSQSGHNCYTWARSQLMKLNIDRITNDIKLEITLHDFFAAQTSKHLVEKDSTSSGCRIM